MFASVTAHPDTGTLLVTLRGRLNLRALTATRRAVSTCLWHYPPAVLVDCAGIGRTGMLPGRLLPLVLHSCARLPEVVVAVCAPAPALHRRLARYTPLGRLSLYPDLRHGLDAVPPHHIPDGVHRVHQRLAPTRYAPGAARQLVAWACRNWGLPDAAGPAQLIASELVSNAVEHAGTAIDVTVCHHAGRLRIAVADRSPVIAVPARHMPAAGPGPDLAFRGRGLPLVAQHAGRYGVLRGAHSKEIWASLDAAHPASRLSTSNVLLLHA